jgi:hypothetical protein
MGIIEKNQGCITTKEPPFKDNSRTPNDSRTLFADKHR